MVRRGAVILCAWMLLAGAGASAATRAEGEDALARADPAVDAPVYRDVEQVPRGVLLARQVDVLIDRVVALNEHHGWGWSEAGALIASLEEAFLDLSRGRLAEAADQLTDFSDRIAGDVRAGSLSREAGLPLLDAAGAILGRIDALERSERLAGPTDGAGDGGPERHPGEPPKRP